MDIFGILGSIFGYVLWAFYFLVKNYGIALILFTLVVKLVMFPVSVNQQKSMAKNARMSQKQQELKQKYGNNKEKLNEEMNKLYAQEGMNTGGCLTMIIPMFLLLGVYYAVVNPLTNTLHLSSETVTSALNNLTTLPGIGLNYQSMYGQIDIIGLVRDTDAQAYLGQLFNQTDLNEIIGYSNGFTFFGFDLLGKPSDVFGGGAAWYLILIPILSFITSVIPQLYSMRKQNNPAQQQGCMKVMFILLPLFTAYIAYTVPAAVGFYWIVSNVLGFVQTLILQHYFGPAQMTAKQEAQRVALLEQKEALVKYEYNPVYEKPANTTQVTKKKRKK